MIMLMTVKDLLFLPRPLFKEIDNIHVESLCQCVNELCAFQLSSGRSQSIEASLDYMEKLPLCI